MPDTREPGAEDTTGEQLPAEGSGGRGAVSPPAHTEAGQVAPVPEPVPGLPTVATGSAAPASPSGGHAGVRGGSVAATGPTAGGQSPLAVALRYVRAGDCGLYVVFPQVVDPAINQRVWWLARQVEQAGWAGVLEVVPSYAALYIHFDPLRVTFDGLVARCRELMDAVEEPEPEVARLYLLPTAYGGEFGPDLDEVARLHGLDPEEVVERHASRDYYIYFLGFSPGFPFLGELDPRLATPRRRVPRTRVPAGSVGIAGQQTGVYPVESPGGWNLIGRTPVPLFDVRREPPALLVPGHYVRFVPISEAEYRRIAAAVAAGEYEPVSVPKASGDGRGGRETGR